MPSEEERFATHLAAGSQANVQSGLRLEIPYLPGEPLIATFANRQIDRLPVSFDLKLVKEVAAE